MALYKRLWTLFDFQPDLLMYDLTSTYFEGHGPVNARHGYSRDRRPRNVRVVVGVVMTAGWPIAHHVQADDTHDSTSVKDLAERFSFRYVIFVGDRGMVTESNLKLLNEEHGFLVGINAREKKEDQARTHVQEVQRDRDSVRARQQWTPRVRRTTSQQSDESCSRSTGESLNACGEKTI